MDLSFTNFATSTIANVGGIAAGDLSVDVQPGDGALFPSLTGSQYFYSVLIDSSGNREIVKVTARATDTLTIVRAQDNTSARAFAQNDVIELRVNSAALEEIWAGSRDMDGEKLVLDAAGVCSIAADTPGQIDVEANSQDQITIVDGTITVPDSILVWNTVTKTIAKVSPSGAANVDVTGLTAGGIYRLTFRLALSAANNLVLTFNGDSGANYSDAHEYFGRSSGAQASNSDDDSSRANIRIGGGVSAKYYEGWIEFASMPGDDTLALVNWVINGFTDTDNFLKRTGSGQYDGAASVTQITVAPAAGTVTGTVIVERIG